VQDLLEKRIGKGYPPGPRIPGAGGEGLCCTDKKKKKPRQDARCCRREGNPCRVRVGDRNIEKKNKDKAWGRREMEEQYCHCNKGAKRGEVRGKKKKKDTQKAKRPNPCDRQVKQLN